jgi:hypothetical protein
MAKKEHAKCERYQAPPKKVFRSMGLGVLKEGHIRVIAGFRFKWWVPDCFGPVEPVIVHARVLTVHQKGDR